MLSFELKDTIESLIPEVACEADRNILTKHFSEGKSVIEISKNLLISTGKIRIVIDRHIYSAKKKISHPELISAKKILYDNQP